MRNLISLHTITDSNELRPSDLVLEPFSASVGVTLVAGTGITTVSTGTVNVPTNLKEVIGVLAGGFCASNGGYSLSTTGVITSSAVPVAVFINLAAGTYVVGGYLIGRNRITG